MAVTLRDHELIMEQFMEDIGRIAGDVRSLVLFGTAARGGIIPGDSDMMDAYLFLRNEVFEDRERFVRDLEVMAAAYARYADAAQFPTHAFFYWNERDPVPAHFHREITSFSKVILGEDIRDRVEATGPGRAAGRMSFFEIRRMGAPLMALLHKEGWAEKERHAVYHGLTLIVKHVPMSACMTLDIWAGLTEGETELRRALPDLDTEVLDRITALRHEPDREENEGRLRGLLKDAMVFVENLNDRLVTELQKAARR